MATLVIHAPKSKLKNGAQLQSFDDMYRGGIGRGFILHPAEVDLINTGDELILLSNEERKRALAKVKKLVTTEKADNGKQRYDVFFDQQLLAKYEYVRLGRNGVAVL